MIHVCSKVENFENICFCFIQHKINQHGCSIFHKLKIDSKRKLKYINLKFDFDKFGL